MDPFLEEPTEWSDCHARLINTISDQLTAVVAPDFLVRIEERVYITTPEPPGPRWMVPDVNVVTRPRREPSPGVAVVDREIITAPTLIEPLGEVEIHDRYLEILDARQRQVITTLEVLSPFNKAGDTSGRRAFLRKRRTILSSQTHWIEIDLLRAGERPREVAGMSDYYALLKRGEESGPYEVWYCDLRDPLPIIAVPLRAPFGDAPLNLQNVWAEVFSRARYADSVDYSVSPPPPPLPPADLAWAAERVATWRAAYPV